MPIDFLSDEQAAAYASFGDELSEADLHRFFFLDDRDCELIARRRRDANRLGYAVQLCAVRALGRFLSAPTEVPTEALHYLASQLGISDIATLGQYARRAETLREHTAEIQRLYRYRDFAPVRSELTAWLTSRSWNRGEGPAALFEASWRWLRNERVLLPGVTTLTRHVATARQQATERMWQVLAAVPSPVESERLEVLLGPVSTSVYFEDI